MFNKVLRELRTLAFPQVTPNLTIKIHFLNYPVSFAAARAGVSQRFLPLRGIACPPAPRTRAYLSARLAK